MSKIEESCLGSSTNHCNHKYNGFYGNFKNTVYSEIAKDTKLPRRDWTAKKEEERKLGLYISQHVILDFVIKWVDLNRS